VLDFDQASEFRRQARAWLELLRPAKGSPTQVYRAAGQTIVVSDWVNCPAGYSIQETLLVRGDFRCGAQAHFGAVYVAGNCSIGKDAIVGALCVEGETVLGLKARVRQWLMSSGLIDLRAGCQMEGPVTSRTAIRLGPGIHAPALLAPEISTRCSTGFTAGPSRGTDLLEVPIPASGRLPEFGGVRAFREDKLTPLGAETWVYDGSLQLPAPVWLRSKLVVRGTFSVPGGSLLEDDVKCGGSLRIGSSSVCKGRLDARGELVLENGCVFSGDLEAGLTLRLSGGVRGIGLNGPVDVWSRERVLIEPDVVVRGRVRGEGGVHAAEPAVEGGLDLLLVQGNQ